MIKNRPLDHIGLAVSDVEKNAQWYQDVLGCTLKGKFLHNGSYVYFLDAGNCIYEMYQEETPADCRGWINHISFTSWDIEADYRYCVEQGYEICTDGIEGIDGFWEKGIRYFKIKSPCGEEIEYCQRL